MGSNENPPHHETPTLGANGYLTRLAGSLPEVSGPGSRVAAGP